MAKLQRIGVVAAAADLCRGGLGTGSADHQLNTIATTRIQRKADRHARLDDALISHFLHTKSAQKPTPKRKEGEREHGGIGLSDPGWDGAQDAPIEECSDAMDNLPGAMEEEGVVGERRRSEEVALAEGGDAGVATAANATAGDESREDGQERLSGDADAQAAIDDTGRSDKRIGLQEAEQENATSAPIAQDMMSAQKTLEMAMPQPVVDLPPADAVHIVDSDALPIAQDDVQVDALQQQAGELNLKTELPAPDLAMPMPTLAPPFELDTTMPPLDALPYTSDGLLEQYAAEEPAPAPVQPATGFAKLEFQDGHFYMTTYAVELGRDMRAYRVAQQYQARMQLKSERHATTGGAKHRTQRSASVPGTPVRPIKNDNAAMSARSFLSESGGIVGEDDGHIKLRKKRRRKGGNNNEKSTDTSSSHSHSNSLSRKNSVVSAPTMTGQKFDYNLAAAMTSGQQQATVDPNATAPLDPMVHMPDPHFTPLIPVHPPMNSDEEFQTGKGISRKHIRISYNFDRCHFEMSVYGRNGAFHDEQHHPAGATVPLHDGSVIQIGGVSLRFVLPTVALEAQTEAGETDFDSVSGRMSFNFEDAHGESVILDDDDEVEEFSSPSARVRALADDYDDYGYDDELLDEDEEGDEEEDDEDEDEDEDEESSEEEPIQKKRGPGRPRIHERKPPPKSKAAAVAAASKKTPTKITLKLSAKDKARERERARLRAEAEERERKRQEAKAKALKLKQKEAARAKARAQAEAAEAAAREKAAAKKAREAEAARLRKEKEKEAAEDSLHPVKEESKEPSKTPMPPTATASADPSSSKEPSAPRIARDAPMQNGEDINVPGLPAGIIIPARKKGPGRPPKDGVMSKRERAQLIKQAKEREKAIKLGLDPSLIPPPPLEPPRSSKPKIPRRNSQGELIPSDTETSKIARPPRSPSPEMRIEDYTEEQLQRPSANYVYLIYEAIKGSKGGTMNLQQIYSAIERRYPWYRFRAGSHGWQSSVRHNLGQHEAFKKVEKEGKGWLWGIKEGVPIERERKKKSPPPPSQHPPYGHGYPPYPQPYGGQQGQGGQGYPPYPPGQAAQYQQRPPNGPPPPNGQQRPPGQQYAPGYAPNNGQQPPPPQQPGNRPPNQHYRPPHPSHANQQKRFKPPSAEVIDTFKKVFISTYASRNNNDTAKAELIVTNAIKRVLEPEAMVGVERGDVQEENVMRAFEGILVQSLGPPRSLGRTTTQGSGQGQGSRPQGGWQGQNPPPQGQQGGQGQVGPHGLPNVQPPQNGQPGVQGTPQQQASGQGQAPPGQSPSTNSPHPHPHPQPHQPPAQQGSHPPPGPSASPPIQQVPPQTAANAASAAAAGPSPSPHPQAVQRAQGPAEQSLYGMLIAGPAPGQRQGSAGREGSGTPRPLPTESAPPPPHVQASETPQPSTQALTQGQGLGLNIPSEPPSSVAPPPAAKETPAPAPPTGAALANAVLNGIPRTMTPTRPAVEPLTPPAVASPKVGAPPIVNAPTPAPVLASGVGEKRAREADEGAAAEEKEGKKARLDEGAVDLTGD